MTARKLIVALALLASASTAALAKGPRYYDYVGGTAGSGAVMEDAQHGAGVAAER